uniref:Uncharacterized protein n=1 Tax=Mus musculus TaxID=10090 RepID=Q3V0T1_MOUSE|nr:unnamed protein product [Mus musculus]
MRRAPAGESLSALRARLTDPAPTQALGLRAVAKLQRLMRPSEGREKWNSPTKAERNWRPPPAPTAFQEAGAVAAGPLIGCPFAGPRDIGGRLGSARHCLSKSGGVATARAGPPRCSPRSRPAPPTHRHSKAGEPASSLYP